MSIADRGLLFFASISLEERRRIGVHTCMGTDLESTHSADVDYAELLPSLFELKAGNFYLALVGERNLRHALKVICKYRSRISGFRRNHAAVDPHIETTAEVRDRSFEPGKNLRGATKTVNF
jgi:5-methyltetrahydropteroyltriglutamate--homocysteine methyltransferase